MSNTLSEKVAALAHLGAGEFAHANGSLLAHLQGTQRLLKEWQASESLQDAGLFHAAYSTAGFDASLVSGERNKVKAIIGHDAEEIVYYYCACDREAYFAQFGGTKSPRFTNRFTGEQLTLSTRLTASFCELTAANEIEIALGSSDFVARHGAGLQDLFERMSAFLSAETRAASNAVFNSAGQLQSGHE